MATRDSSAPPARRGPAWGPGAPWWRYRELYMALVGRDLRARYKGSLLGFAWTLLNPLLLMIVYTLLFAIIIRLQIPNYALFVLSGLLPWLWFQQALIGCSGSVIANASLIRRVAFPLGLLPAVAVSTHAIHFLLALPLLFACELLFGVRPGPSLVLLPLLVLLQFALALGLGLVLAGANVFFRDVEHSLSLLLMVWMYLTPVLYDPAMLPPGYQFLAWVNPMAPLIVAYRAVLFQGTWPDAAQLAIIAAWAAASLATGWLVFSRLRWLIPEAV